VTSVADVRRVLGAHLPGRRVGSVMPLGGGLDNVTFEVDGELVVRFARDPDPERLDREARLLAAVARVSPLPVPEPVLAVPDLGCLAYPKLRGTPLLDLLDLPDRLDRPGGQRAASIAEALGGFLAALHGIPSARVAGLVDVDDTPLAEWWQEAAATYPAVAPHLPPEHRPPVEAFLDAAPPDDARDAAVFTHHDLGIEHVLVDPVTWTVTGIVDWSDAAITDPAHDFGLLLRDLGPEALDAALDAHGTAAHDRATLRDRATFHARCGLLEDLDHGLRTGGRAYVDKSLAALAWLYPAGLSR
jgi:aminoglycoside phosphotransferase (APT) family kinase protein